MVTVSGNPRSFKERHLDMDVRRSATKHGIKPEDSVTAATTGCVFKAHSTKSTLNGNYAWGSTAQ